MLSRRCPDDEEKRRWRTDEPVLLTVLLPHDRSRTLDDIMAHFRTTGFYRDFPPEGTELVSWVVAMSYGFIIQLRVEPRALRTLNFAPIAAQLKRDHGT